MLTKETVDFLKKLDENNNREWFTANKALFLAANDNVIALSAKVINLISEFDPKVGDADPKKSVFRIYRDVRFSMDKVPYKNNLGAFITSSGDKRMPGYYFHIQPKMFFAAAGKHNPDSAELLKIRTAIANNSDEFLRIINEKAFVERFGEFDGAKLTRPPRGFSADSAVSEYVKLKSFAVSQSFSEKEATDSMYPQMLAESFKTALPLVAFLIKALS